MYRGKPLHYTRAPTSGQNSQINQVLLLTYNNSTIIVLCTAALDRKYFVKKMENFMHGYFFIKFFGLKLTDLEMKT